MGLESQSPQERAEQQRIAAEAARRRAAEAKRREEAKRKAEEEARRREAEKPQQDKATIEAKAAEARKRFQERIRNHEAEEQAKAEQIRQHEATKATLDKIRAQAQEKKAAIPPANAPHFAKTNLDSIREQALLKKEQQQNVKPQQAKLAQDLKQHSGIQNILNRSSFTGALGLGAGLLNPLVGASILGSSLFSPTPKSPVDQKSPQDEPKKSSGFFNKILSLGSQAIEGAKALGGKTAESVKPLGNDIAEVAKPAVISQPQTEEKKGGGGLFGSMISFGKKAFQGATQLGSEAIEAAKTVVSQPQTEEKKDGGGLLGSVMSFGRKAFEGAKTVAAAVNPLVSAATLGGPSEEKKDAGGGLFGSVMSFGKKAFEGAKAFGEKAVENAQHLGSDVVQGAKAVGSWVEKNKDLVKDIGHTALDVAGFIPVIGTAADLVNAGWYAAEGRYTEAAASAMSAIPGVGDAFAAGKMGVKLATSAPKAMKVIQTASHLAPMAPALFQAGDAALHGDFSQAALTAGTAFVPALGGKAGQRLLSKAESSGSKMQTFAGNVLARGSGAMPNAIGATQVYQTYEAYKNGEGSGWELAKSALYAGAPFAFGQGRKKTSHSAEAHPLSFERQRMGPEGKAVGQGFTSKEFPTPELIQKTNDPLVQRRMGKFADLMSKTANEFEPIFSTRFKEAKTPQETNQVAEEGYQWWVQKRYEMLKPDPKLLNDIQPGDPNRDPFGKIPGLMENGQPTPAYRTRAEIGELVNQRFSGVDKSVDVIENQITLPREIAVDLRLESPVVPGNKLLRGKAADAIDAERLATKPPEKQYGYASDSEKFITETGEPKNQRVLHDAGIKMLSRLVSGGSSLKSPQDLQRFSEAAYFLFQGPIKNRGSDSVIRGFVSSIGRQLTGEPIRLPQDVDIQAYGRSQKDFSEWLTKALQHPENSKETLTPLGGRGPTPMDNPTIWGSHKGAMSGRPFFPDEIGLPIRNLSTKNVKVTPRGIDVVEKHLSRFGDDPQNSAAIARLREVELGKLEASPEDLNFYTHELREYTRYRKLGYESGTPSLEDEATRMWNNTHTATLEDYGLKDNQLYHPSTQTE